MSLLACNSSLSAQEKIYQTEGPSSFVSIEYHSNGKIKNITEQGNEFGCIMAVGTEFHFDSNGALLKRIKYDNWLPKKDEGCHSTIQDKYIIEFYPSGKIKEQNQIESAYEGEEMHFGDWVKYSEDGKEISRTTFKKKFTK